jgi:hypothetical protein
VNKNDSRILQKRKHKLAKRLERTHWPAQPGPVFKAQNIHYEMADRVRAIDCGGLGAFHLLARNSGLIDVLNDSLKLFKIHLPYHESDHVLNIAYNTLAGGTCLDDIELLRKMRPIWMPWEQSESLTLQPLGISPVVFPKLP